MSSEGGANPLLSCKQLIMNMRSRNGAFSDPRIIDGWCESSSERSASESVEQNPEPAF